MDKRKLFLDDSDRFRFIHDLFEFNNLESANNVNYFFRQNKKNQYMDIGRPYIDSKRKPRKLLVEILAFCLMNNHYHLLLRPLNDQGISQFMKKINMGYAKYFNEKYQRSGALFQGRYKLVHINQEAHFIHIPYYIHLNPLDLIAPEWRERKIKDYNKAIQFLENYRWSSHIDYLGKKNFQSVTQREFLLNYFGGTTEYGKNIKEWIKHLNLEDIKETLLE
ncbi:MAG: hypothetical protein A3J53_02380 [Candidatus Harrisonbacteria bacterium RIFCSPHIGHO2_02_FULL_40_20]|nr:MAG: hypothetical protein A3J53_02380 [Candidatus Harrisonbacteria bacterium RIFCSPHIGHO2_02_FULL_40_20]